MTTYAHDGETVFAVWHGESEARAETVAVIEAHDELLDAVCAAMTEVSEALWASYGAAEWFYPRVESDRLGTLAAITVGADPAHDHARLTGACGALHDVLGRLDEAAGAVIVTEMHGELARVVHAEHGETHGRAGQLQHHVLVATSLEEVFAAHQALSTGGELVGHRHVRCVALVHRVRAAVVLVASDTPQGGEPAGEVLTEWFGDDAAVDAVSALLGAAEELGCIPAVRRAAGRAAGEQGCRWYDETWAALCEVLWRLAERWGVRDAASAEAFEREVSALALDGTERLVDGVLLDVRPCWCEGC